MPQPHPMPEPHRRAAVRARPPAQRPSFLAIKDANVLLTTPPNGQLPTGAGHEWGLYHHDCRFLSGYELVVDGLPCDAVEQASESRSSALIRLSSPGDERAGRRECAIRWQRRVDGAGPALRDSIRLENRGHEASKLTVQLRFVAGFEDLFAVRGLRSARGTFHRERIEDGALVFGYLGRDGIERETRVSVTPAPRWQRGSSRKPSTARLDLVVPPLGGTTIEVRCSISERRSSGVAGPFAAPRRDMGGWPRIESDSPGFDRIVRRAVDDLRMLRSEHEGHAFYSAGVPWFTALFGRDSLVTGLQVLPFEQATAEGTLRLLAQFQGVVTDAWRDEQPGKILHELRLGELAGTRRVPHGPIYASIDATPLFLILLGQHATWTGDLALFEELRGAFDRALEWIEVFGDRDGDGYIEYLREAHAGPANQGWKDSWDAIVDDRGRLARPPIALVEAQAYVYRAWLEAASLLDLVAETARAQGLRERAARLRRRFEVDFWLPEASFYALGLDARKRPLRVATSNPGHVLWAGLTSPEHARAVARRLLARDLFNGWGLRTLSTREARYEPLGYHLGTVWPHDTAFAIAGLRRYGFDRQAERLARGLLEAAARFPQRRMPEAFSGAARSSATPLPYPEANRPQAWAAGAVLHVLQALLGLAADAPARRIRLIRPMLPPEVGRLDIAGIRVGAGSVDLHVRRRDGGLDVDIANVAGGLEVEVVDAWPEPGMPDLTADTMIGAAIEAG